MKGKSNAKTHAEYIVAVEDGRREDIQRLHDLVGKLAPELEPTMEFGMLGYGKYHYKYKTGREGDWIKIGIANNCVRFKRLSDLDEKALADLIGATARADLLS